MMKLTIAGAALGALALTFGCATPPSPAIKSIDAGAYVQRNAGLDYAACRPRKSEELLNARLIADITLMDIEEATARKLLDLRGPADIAPRVFKDPIAETLAAFMAMNDVGEVLLRPSMAIMPGSPVSISYDRDFAWLADHKVNHGESAPGVPVVAATPVVNSAWEGARGKLEVNSQADGSYQLSLDSESTQVMRPVPTFATSLGPNTAVKIQTPQMVNQKRVASQDVKLGETAVFQLSAARGGANPMMRVLCVRIEKP